jgi:hypothetical protein
MGSLDEKNQRTKISGKCTFKDFLSIWHLKLIGLIGPRAVGERVKCSTSTVCRVTVWAQHKGLSLPAFFQNIDKATFM